MKIGIDLGTTYSAVAFINEEGKAEIIPNAEDERTTPSVVSFDDDTILVGKEAKKCSKAKAENTVQFAKRFIGSDHEFSVNNQKFRSEMISSMILKKLKQDSEAYLQSAFGEDAQIDAVVITVPAYFNDANRIATREAGKIAGLNVVGIINEPTAAAIAYSVKNEVKNETVLVYDLGGGTFDVTILDIKNGSDLNVVATDGFRHKGGGDIDAMIADLVMDAYEEAYPGLDFVDDRNAYQELLLQAEDAKITLSKPNKKHVKIALTANAKPIEYDLKLEEFEEMIDEFVEETFDKVSEMMEECSYSWDKIDKVIMIGGSSKIPYIQRKMAQISGKQIRVTINPDEAVAMGAAYFAEAKTALKEHDNAIPTTAYAKGTQTEGLENGGKQLVSKININEVTSHGLGVVCRNPATEKMMNSVIIDKNTTIPVMKSEVYYTIEDNQNAIGLHITEGESEDLNYVQIISATEVPIDPHPANSPVEITISLDEFQIIHIYVKDLVTNANICEVPLKRSNSLSEEEVTNQQNYLDELSIE